MVIILSNFWYTIWVTYTISQYRNAQRMQQESHEDMASLILHQSLQPIYDLYESKEIIVSFNLRWPTVQTFTVL